MKNKGITLIALIITIIVLIILAGVSINLLIGENGIITKAKYAKEIYEESEKKQILGLQELDSEVQKLLTGEQKAYPTLDSKAGVLEGQGTAEKPYLIESIEDLVAFSNIVNTGENLGIKYDNPTYENEYICLTQTLDFESNNSYVDPASTMFGDLNKDGVVEGIKNELTKKGTIGFSPIGYKLVATKLSADEDFIQTGYFDGTFDGQNHEIKNIYINRSDETTTELNKNEVINTETYPYTNNLYCTGLFGHAAGKSSIKNLGVSGEIICKDSGASSLVAGIVAYAWENEVINCYNKCNITVNEANVGGITGSNSYGIIKNCYNFGSINVQQSDTNSGYAFVGGITCTLFQSGTMENCINYGDFNFDCTNKIVLVGGIAYTVLDSNVINCKNKGNINMQKELMGYAGGLIYGLSNSIVENSINEGNILIENDNSISASGVITLTSGEDEVVLNNCDNTGIIKIKTSSVVYAGGILGRNNCSALKVKNCYNGGNIDVNSNDATYVGGIVGIDRETGGLIENCYNVGNIVSSGSASDVGGIGGMIKNGMIIKNCYNTGNISSSIAGSNICDIGGICGRGYNSFQILNCYNVGDVYGKGYNLRVGGILGQSNFDTESKKSTRTVENCYNRGKVSGDANNDLQAAGIIAHVKYSKAINCYNLGKITGTSENEDGLNLGGVTENNNTPTVTGCYYLKGTCESDQNATEKETITPSELLGWLNTNRKTNAEWAIKNDINDGYPVFK